MTKVIKAPDASTLLQPRWMRSNQPYLRTQASAEWDLAPGWTIGGAIGRGEAKRGGYAWGYCDSTIILDDLGSAACTPDCYPNNRELWSGAVTVRGRVKSGPLTHRLSAVYNRTSEDAAFALFSSPDTYLFNIYDPRFPGEPAKPDVTLARSLLRTTNGVTLGDEIAVLDERLLVTLGGRRSEFRNRSYNPGTGAKTRDLKYGRWTPAAGIVFKPTSNVSVYANYVEALSAGGQAPAGAVNANELLGAAVSDQVEIGAKVERGMVRATLAAFRINQPNEYLDLATRVYGRFGEKRNEGIEVSLQGAPTHALTVLASMMYLDAKLRKTADGPDPDTRGDMDGNRASGAARWQGALSADWELPGLGGLAVNGGLTYTGSTFVDDDDRLRLPAWTRVDAGIRYPFTAGARSFAARLNVQNVFDQDKWISIYGGGGISTAQPRTLIASLAVDL